MHEGHAFRQLCRRGTTDLVEQMLKAGFPIDAAQEDGTTGLWLACEGGCLDTVRLLLSYRANPNSKRVPGDVTPLFIAAQNGHAAVVDELLAHGANPNSTKSSGTSPLFIASQQNYPDVVHALLKSGAVVDAMNANGVSPLAVASFRGNSQCVKHLLSAGADPHHVCQGRTSLDWAAAGGFRHEIQLIVEQHLRNLEAEVQRRRADSRRVQQNQALVSRATAAEAAVAAATSDPRQSPMGSSANRSGTSIYGAASARPQQAPFSGGSTPWDRSDVFAWYEPKFLCAPTHHANDRSTSRTASPPAGRSRSTVAPATLYSTQSFTGPADMRAAAMQPPSALLGMTQTVLAEEERRSRSFRTAMKRSQKATVPSNDAHWATAGRPGSAGQLKNAAMVYSVEQDWLCHKDRLEAQAQLSRANYGDVTDAWLYSTAVTSSYSRQMLDVRRQMDEADRQNREQREQNARRAQQEKFQLPPTAPEKVTSLVAFMEAGAGAKGPPPPLPPEEMEAALPPPAVTSGDDFGFGSSSVGVRPAAEPEKKLTALERLKLKQQASRSS